MPGPRQSSRLLRSFASPETSCRHCLAASRGRWRQQMPRPCTPANCMSSSSPPSLACSALLFFLCKPRTSNWSLEISPFCGAKPPSASNMSMMACSSERITRRIKSSTRLPSSIKKNLAKVKSDWLAGSTTAPGVISQALSGGLTRFWFGGPSLLAAARRTLNIQ